MGDEELYQRVADLRAQGRSPKQIARALGVRPCVVAPLIRRIASAAAADAPEPAVVGCWLSPGWSAGLAVERDRGWPDRPGFGSEGSGLVAVLVARERRGGDRVSVCGWLVDTYCLGVKDALGPRTLDRHELASFVRAYFAAFDGDPVPASIELASGLVWGGVEYARELGFDPARDFPPTAGHLEAPSGSCGIAFGHRGQPVYIQGPYDDVDRIMRTLGRSQRPDDYHFVVEVPT